MACCAAAAYIVWRLVKLHEQLFHAPKNLSQPRLAAPDSKPAILDQHPPENDDTSHNRFEGFSNHSLNVKTCILSIRGITCGACVGQIQSALDALDAVNSVQISLVLLRARVEYNSSDVLPADLVSLIEDLGYEASVISSPGSWRSIQDITSTLAQSDAAWNQSVRQLRHEFFLTIAISSSVVIASYGFPWVAPRGKRLLFAFQAAAASACLLVSRRMHLRAIHALLRGAPRTVTTLASTAIITAFLQAILPLAIHMWRASRFIDATRLLENNALGSMTTLCTVILGGQLIKVVSSRRSFGQASCLANLLPQLAAVVSHRGSPVSDEVPSSVAIDMLEPGDTVIVREDERLPADGEVLEGTAEVDQSWMTGDDQTAHVMPGCRVFAGCRVTEGQLRVLIEKCGTETRLGNLLGHVSKFELDSRSTPVEKQSATFVDAILLLVITAIFIWRFMGLPWQDCSQRMVCMLVCACPCALELGVPISLISAAVSASKANIQLSTISHRVENAASIKTVLFDKTGTLTTGKLSINWHVIEPHWSETTQQKQEWWAMVGAAEHHARKHPLSLPIIRESEMRMKSASDIEPRVSVTRAHYEPGKGVQAWIVLEEKAPIHVAVGSRSFLTSLGIKLDTSQVPETARLSVGTLVCVAIDHKQAGLLLCGDVIRPSARRLVKNLSRQGVQVGMLTGDSWNAASVVARSVGIPVDHVYAEMLPLDKAQVVRDEKRRGPVMVVGDNFNDMAAFAESSFSVYVGSGHAGAGGTDAMLLPVAGVGGERLEVLVTESEEVDTNTQDGVDLEKLQTMMVLAQQTVGKIRQNKFLSLAYNLVALTLASGALEGIHPYLIVSP